jgi:hypothetical protein
VPDFSGAARAPSTNLLIVPIFVYRTTCIDSPDGWTVRTTCEIRQGETVIGAATHEDSSSDPTFAMLIDRSLASGDDTSTVARWVIDIQREWARDLALAGMN